MNILIVDDHLLFADVLALALDKLSSQIDKTNCAEATYTALQNKQYDLVLLDINLPDIHGEVVLQKIKTTHPEMKVIVVSATRVDIDRIMHLGANGFINKSENIDTMISAIEHVGSGKDYYPTTYSNNQINKTNFSVTPRQIEIIQSMSEGLTNKQIAHQLNIGEGTVKQQINRIFRTLDVSNRTQCIIKAGELKLVPQLDKG